jgi:hypothetical protein
VTGRLSETLVVVVPLVAFVTLVLMTWLGLWMLGCCR